MTKKVDFLNHPIFRKLLLFISEYKDQHPYSPDHREMMLKTGISSTSVINYYLGRMEADGLVSFLYKTSLAKKYGEMRQYRCARTIHLTDLGRQLIQEQLADKNPIKIKHEITV